MNYFRKLKLRKLYHEGWSIGELVIMYKEHTEEQLKKAVRGVKQIERML